MLLGKGLLDALKIQQAVVMGGSMGGMIAQMMAINHIERIRGLMLVFSSGTQQQIPFRYFLMPVVTRPQAE